MNEEIQNPRSYAHLPEELLGKILENVPATVDKMNRLFDIQDEPIKAGMDDLKKRGMIELLSSTDCSTSLMAADGGMILEKMTGTDLLLAVAVGVEGLGKGDTGVLQETYDSKQYKEGIWLCTLTSYPQFGGKNFFDLNEKEKKYGEISWWRLRDKTREFLTNYFKN